MGKSYAVTIGAKNNTSKAFKEIKGDLRGVNVSLTGVTSKMRDFSGVGVAALGAVGVAAAAGLGVIITQAADAASEIKNLSVLAGAAPEQFQKMAFGARFLGIEQDKLSDILKDTNDKLGDFFETGGGAAKDFFDNIAPKVGVTAEQFKNLSGPDALQLYYTSLEKANLSQAQMTFYMEAIANDATLLAPLLRDGGVAMREQAKEAERLGLVLSEVELGVLADADVKIKSATAGLGAFINHLAADFAPLISVVSDEFLDAAKEAGGFGEISTKVFNVIIKGAGFAADVVRGLQAVFLIVQGVVARTVEVIVGTFAMVENGYRELANLIPGVEVKTTGFLSNVQESLTSVRVDIQNQLAELAAAPMPSEGLVVWAEEATAKVQAAVAEAKAAIVSDEKVGVEFDPTSDPESVNTLARINYISELKKFGVASDLESEELAFLQKMELLNTNFSAVELPEIQRRDAIKFKLAEKHEKNLTRIKNKGLTERQKFEKKTGLQQTKQVFGEMANVTAGVASHNKGLFEINKVAGIANAVINTYTGVSQSLAAYPMPIAAVMAATHLAAGLAQVSAIRSQSFGSGGGGGGTVAVGTVPVTTAPSNIALSPTGSDDLESKETAKVVNITLNIDDDGVFSGTYIRNLMERIGEETEAFNVSY